MDLKEYIEKENLLLPDYNNLNIVDLVKFLYGKYGVKYDKNKNTKKLEKIIPDNTHTVFILVDGMGSNLVSLLDDKSLLKKNKVDNMLTVSPSSTGCVLTSIATATYPSEHGMIGWYNYNREYDIDYYPLTFNDRKQNKSLKEYNITAKDIFKVKSKINELNVKTNVLYPHYIFDSVYSNYVANNNIRNSYSDLEDAFNQIEKIISLNERTFTYLYIPDIDNLEHENGVDSKIVLDKLKKIEKYLYKLLKNDTTIVITADHGQTNVSDDIIMDFEKYNKYFYAYPGIDFGMATYYVKKDLETEFVKQFNNDYKHKMYLFKTKEFIDNNVFGPNINNDYLISNLGEYISLCNKNAQFINSLEIDEYYGKTKGNHSGLSNDEMIIPLIIIDTNNLK